MIMAGQWREPLPERPRNLDDAIDRGFDPHEVDRYLTPEPLTPEWQDALDRSVIASHHRRDPSVIDDHCGERCDRCDERICNVYGPELAVTCAAHFECVSCEADNPCRECAQVRRNR